MYTIRFNHTQHFTFLLFRYASETIVSVCLESLLLVPVNSLSSYDIEGILKNPYRFK